MNKLRLLVSGLLSVIMNQQNDIFPYSWFVNTCCFLFSCSNTKNCISLVRWSQQAGLLSGIQKLSILQRSVMYYTMLSFSSCQRVWPLYINCLLLKRFVKKVSTVVHWSSTFRGPWVPMGTYYGL